jgi:IS4 transposase
MREIYVEVSSIAGDLKGFKKLLVLPHKNYKMRYIDTDYETIDGAYQIFQLEEDLFLQMRKKNDLVAVKKKTS